MARVLVSFKDGDRRVSLSQIAGRSGRARLKTPFGDAEVGPERRMTFMGFPSEDGGAGWTAFGGLLPDGTVSAELVFGSGERVVADADNGAWGHRNDL